MAACPTSFGYCSNW